MNEIEGWYEILRSWEKVKRMKKLNQELYDLLFGAIAYIIEYSKKYGIPIPKKDEIKRAADRIHYLMDQIEPPISSDEDLHDEEDSENRRRLDRTLLCHRLTCRDNR